MQPRRCIRKSSAPSREKLCNDLLLLLTYDRAPEVLDPTSPRAEKDTWKRGNVETSLAILTARARTLS